MRLYDGAPEPANLIASHAPERLTGNVTRIEVQLADRPMTVEVESARGDALSLLSMITLLFGIAVASLSMLVARLLTQQAANRLHPVRARRLRGNPRFPYLLKSG